MCNEIKIRRIKLKKYDVIYADPPWKQTKGGMRKTRPNQGKNLDYKTINLNEIKTILNSVKSNTMFLWTIDKFLFDAQNIAEDLGFKLHARIIWDKENGVAPAFTVRYSHEYLLWLYKSPMLKIEKNMRGKFTTVLREKSTKHSKKPTSAYEMIEALYPNTKKLELFARNKRDGWDSWGNEVESDIKLSYT
jgi:N6-adenosine-specific RNA methylase IME4